MIEDNWKQAEQEDLKEINLLSKKLLKKAGQSPEEGTLYCLQLARWAVENIPLNIHQEKPGLMEWLDNLQYHWSPKGAMAMLEDDEDYTLAHKVNQDDPKAVAVLILDQLDSRLSARVNGYPLPVSPKNYR